MFVQPDRERRKHGALQAVAFLEEQRPRAGLLLVVLSGHVAASSRARRIPRSEQELTAMSDGRSGLRFRPLCSQPGGR